MATKRKKNASHAGVMQRKMDLSKYPPLIRELLQKHEGNMLKASRAVGRTTGYWLNRMATQKDAFNEAAQDIVRRAIAGDFIAKTSKTSAAAKVAIVIVKADRFEQLYDIAQVMSGQWEFKRKAGTDWIGVLKMPGNELDAYLAMAKAKGAEFYVT